MSGLRWLTSPLAGTVAVLAGLALISFPLRKLTSAQPVAEVKAAAAVLSENGIPTVLRVKLLASTKRLTLETPDSGVVLDLTDQAAGESEHDAVVRLTDDGLDLRLVADFGGETAQSPETAVFLTVMPDGYEEKTLYATGSGRIEETLHFDWHHHHRH